MKRIKLIAVAVCLCSVLFAQSAANDLLINKIAIGAGLSSNTGLGGNVKADYHLSDKLSVGLKCILTGNVSEYNTKIYKVEYLPGSNLAATLSSTYYILGKNNMSSKAGLYVGLGLGYFDSETSATTSTLLPVTDTKYIQRTVNDGANGFSALINIGGDYKLGPGKIYADFSLPFILVGTVFSHYSNQTGLNPSTDKTSPYTGIYPAIFINLGYQINL